MIAVLGADPGYPPALVRTAPPQTREPIAGLLALIAGGSIDAALLVEAEPAPLVDVERAPAPARSAAPAIRHRALTRAGRGLRRLKRPGGALSILRRRGPLRKVA